MCTNSLNVWQDVIEELSACRKNLCAKKPCQKIFELGNGCTQRYWTIDVVTKAESGLAGVDFFAVVK